jgi:hypothetical protein
MRGGVWVEAPAPLGGRRLGRPPGGPWDPRILDRLPQGAWEFATTRFGGDPMPLDVPEEACSLVFLGMPGVVRVGSRERPAPGVVEKGRGEPVAFIAGEWGLRFWVGIEPAGAAPGQFLPSPPPAVLRYIPLEEPWEGELEAGLESSRMGMRLRGFDGQLRAPAQTEPSVFGAIQAAPGGELLIHGPEGPVTGGYPKLGGLIRADLGCAAQVRPGQAIRLVPVTLEEARRAGA